MPLPGAVSVSDEFRALARDKNNTLATRIEQKRELTKSENANDLQPDVPDWLKAAQPIIPASISGTPQQNRLTGQLGSIGQLGTSASEASQEALAYKQRVAAARALANQQALSERQRNLLDAYGNLKFDFGDYEGGTDAKGKRASVINAAKRLLGLPYSWGGGHGSKAGASYGIGRGSGTYGVDCSGLVRYAFAKAGIKKWGGQAVAATQSMFGRAAPIKSLLPGDLVVKGGRGGAHHIAIYIGNGRILEAQRTGTRVHIRSIKGQSGWTGIHLNY